MIESFLKKNNTTLEFNNTQFRQGARVTCPFGLAEGYTLQSDGSLKFDTVRIHTGVDRSGLYNNNGSYIRNVVYSPFNFNRSASIYYGPNTSYGFLIQLFDDEFGFEMRIAHMNPDKDLLPEMKTLFESKGSVKSNEFLGQAGNFGVSGGLHTHAEFLSQEETCPLLDQILFEKFKEDSNALDYSDMELGLLYQSKEKWVGKSLQEVKDHYNALKTAKGISTINKYKFTYIDPSSRKKRTRYSSYYLFNGL